mmetsp:Transcript_24949/g.62219  ORF Transcript_24949/g.62219 Transcript_24949/m.62219 type:complete len:266 (-) Transcript_24949:2-799(-)
MLRVALAAAAAAPPCATRPAAAHTVEKAAVDCADAGDVSGDDNHHERVKWRRCWVMAARAVCVSASPAAAHCCGFCRRSAASSGLMADSTCAAAASGSPSRIQLARDDGASLAAAAATAPPVDASALPRATLRAISVAAVPCEDAPRAEAFAAERAAAAAARPTMARMCVWRARKKSRGFSERERSELRNRKTATCGFCISLVAARESEAAKAQDFASGATKLLDAKVLPSLCSYAGCVSGTWGHAGSWPRRVVGRRRRRCFHTI